MAIGSGLGGQIGVAAESSYGTYVAPTRFPEFTKESLKLKKTTAQSAGIAAGRLVPLSSRRRVPQREGGGTVDMEVTTRLMGLFLQNLMGTTVTPVQQAATDAYLQTHVLVDTAGKSLTIQKGVPLTTGVVTRKNFTGCKIISAEFSCEAAGNLMASFEIDARDCEETSVLATASYPVMSVFDFSQMGILTGAFGAEAVRDGIRKMSVKIERPMATDRFYANQAGLKKEPITNDQVKITGSMEGDYVDAVLDNIHTSDAPTSLLWEFVGAEIEDPYFETFRIALPSIHVDDEPPAIDGFDVVKTKFAFTALFDGTNPNKIEYISTDTTV